jgi:dTDP-4-dehydrorhamnose reductase
MTRVLVTGAAGVVGSALVPRLVRHHLDCVLVDRDFPAGKAGNGREVRCDLLSPDAVARLIDEVNPDVVLHLAGNKDVFALEVSPELAQRANVETTANLLHALDGRETFFVFVSTDYVFEGTAGPYRETSPTHPTTAYGRSKLAAEQCLREGAVRVAIARSAALFGYPNDFVSVVTASLARGERFTAFTDLVSTPTFVGDLAQMLARLIDKRLAGTFHLCGRDSVSRVQFARLIAKAFELDHTLVQAQERTERIRPPDLALDGTATWNTLEYWPESLAKVLADFRRQAPTTFLLR